MKGNVDGVAFLLKKNKIDSFHGQGRIVAQGKVEVTDANGKKQTLDAHSHRHRHGLGGRAIPGIAIDEKKIVSSTGALSLAQGTEALGRDRRGLYRARARLGLATPWRRR